jgi:hypothetical protein
MANTNQSTTGVVDFFTKLSAFLTPLGWVENEAPTTDRFAISKTATGVALHNQFRWVTGSPDVVGIYQSTGWASMTDPGAQAGDSGMGATGTINNTTLAAGRHVKIGSSPIQFWAFADGTNHYCHVVVQTDTNLFVHFGFGVIDKVGDWVGGEYTYGMYNNAISVNSTGTQRGDFLSYGLDGRATYHNNVVSGAITETGLLNSLPTLRVAASSFPGNAVSDWSVVAGARHPFTGTVGNDRAGDLRSRTFGGFRDGTTATSFGRFNGRATDGVVPLYQIPLFYTSSDTGIGAQNFYLGRQRDVRGVNIAFFEPGETINIGGETWQVFPVEPKGTVPGSFNGFAYRVF